MKNYYASHGKCDTRVNDVKDSWQNPAELQGSPVLLACDETHCPRLTYSHLDFSVRLSHLNITKFRPT